jgi:hypothetical protein
MTFAQTRKFCARRAHRSKRGGDELGIFLGQILVLAIAAAESYNHART